LSGGRSRTNPEKPKQPALLHRNGAGIAATCLLLGACAGSAVEQDASLPPSSSPADDAAPPAWLQAGASVGDGVFTAAQSRRGELQYMNTCKRCHQRDLAGDFVEDAPPLVGDEFLANWAQWTVGDLFEFLTTEMPPKKKDRRDLTAEDYADVLAFILEKNGFPAGQKELPPETDSLVTIEMNPGK